MSSEDIKPGYKRTEVGVIPEDWVVRQLSEHFQIYAGGDVPKNSLSQIRSKTHPHPIFANALQNKGLYGFTAERRSKADSLTVTARGFLGHAEYRTEEFFPIVRLLVLEPMGGLDARFTTYAINERVSFAFESTGVPQLTAPQIRKYSVAAPSEPEQRAIATALSDVDTLLAKLDQLIAKKRDLKQATMQQLLTGQTRLPGFSGAWDIQTIEEFERAKLLQLSRGNVISKKDIERIPGDFPIYSSSVKGDGIFGTYGEHMFDEELITWSVDGGGHFFHRPRHKFSVTNVSGFMRIDTSKIRYRYLAAQLQYLHGSLSFDYTSKAHPSVIRKAYAVPLPSLHEQTAIATVLSDMDAELAALEARRDKTRALKQGMMQELLTGRIRLV